MILALASKYKPLSLLDQALKHSNKKAVMWFPLWGKRDSSAWKPSPGCLSRKVYVGKWDLAFVTAWWIWSTEKEDTMLCLNRLSCCVKFSINHPAARTGVVFSFLMIKTSCIHQRGNAEIGWEWRRSNYKRSGLWRRVWPMWRESDQWNGLEHFLRTSRSQIL